MHIQVLSNRRAALVWFGIIGILTAAQTFAIIVSGSNATAEGTVPFVILGYLLLVVTLIVPLILLGLDGALRGAAAGDNRRAPLAFGQLNPVGALAPDEALTLTRTMTGGAMAQTITLYLALFAFLGALPVLLALLAATPVTTLYPLGAVWLAILVVYIGRAIWITMVARTLTVQADARGITVRAPLHRARSIAWDDIRVVLRTLGTQGGAIAGSYFLLGSTAALGFSLQGMPVNRNVPARFTYSGGEAAYTEQAKRLLATIAARSQAPLRVPPVGVYARTPNRTYPLLGLNATDVQTMPPAHPAFQPSLAGIQVAPMQTQQVTLRAQGSLFNPAAIVLVTLGALVLFFVLGESALIATSPTGQTDPSAQATLVLTNLIPVVLVIVLVFILGLRGRQNQRAVTVDAAGITGSPMVAGLPPVHIPWSAVRAWVVLPPTPRINAATYAIFSDGPTILWQEPLGARLAGPVQGDRAAAFRMQADILRAIIATRSGQILRQAPVRG
jgi:hypothetical protein